MQIPRYAMETPYLRVASNKTSRSTAAAGGIRSLAPIVAAIPSRGMKKHSKGKRRGRPPAPPDRAKSQQINVRVTASLRADLDAAAAKSRRNLSDEIANRLSESLTRPDGWRPFGSRENYAACRLIAEFMQVLRHETGESWIRNAWAKEQLKAGISTILDLIGPSEMPERPKVSGLSPEEVDETGARIAQILVAVTKNSQASTRLLSHLASDLRLHSRREPGLGDLFSAFVKGKR